MFSDLWDGWYYCAGEVLDLDPETELVRSSDCFSGLTHHLQDITHTEAGQLLSCLNGPNREIPVPADSSRRARVSLFRACGTLTHNNAIAHDILVDEAVSSPLCPVNESTGLNECHCGAFDFQARTGSAFSASSVHIPSLQRGFDLAGDDVFYVDPLSYSGNLAISDDNFLPHHAGDPSYHPAEWTTGLFTGTDATGFVVHAVICDYDNDGWYVSGTQSWEVFEFVVVGNGLDRGLEDAHISSIFYRAQRDSVLYPLYVVADPTVAVPNVAFTSNEYVREVAGYATTLLNNIRAQAHTPRTVSAGELLNELGSLEPTYPARYTLMSEILTRMHDLGEDQFANPDRYTLGRRDTVRQAPVFAPLQASSEGEFVTALLDIEHDEGRFVFGEFIADDGQGASRVDVSEDGYGFNEASGRVLHDAEIWLSPRPQAMTEIGPRRIVIRSDEELRYVGVNIQNATWYAQTWDGVEWWNGHAGVFDEGMNPGTTWESEDGYFFYQLDFSFFPAMPFMDIATFFASSDAETFSLWFMVE